MNTLESTTGSRRKSLQILAIGDCNTSGVEGAEPGTQIVHQVAAQLESSGYDCHVRNLGRSMSTSREGVACMEREGAPADLLLLNFGLVDAWVTSIPGIYISYYPDHFAKKWARKLLKSVKRRLRAAYLRCWVPFGEVVPIDEYERNVCRILDLAEANNPDVCCVLWGAVAVPDDKLRSQNIGRYNECLRLIAEQRPRTRYLDAASQIQELPLAEAYLDDVHISCRAAQCVAEEVARACLDDLLRFTAVEQRCAA